MSGITSSLSIEFAVMALKHPGPMLDLILSDKGNDILERNTNIYCSKKGILITPSPFVRSVMHFSDDLKMAIIDFRNNSLTPGTLFMGMYFYIQKCSLVTARCYAADYFISPQENATVFVEWKGCGSDIKSMDRIVYGNLHSPTFESFEAGMIDAIAGTKSPKIWKFVSPLVEF